MTQLDFINGRTRMYAIVGEPIEQVRSPEMVSWEFRRRGLNSMLVPLHLPAAGFEEVFARLQEIRNLDGLIVTVPFKARALAFARHVGAQARAMGGCNVLARRRDGSWAADMLDGMGCVEALRRRGYAIEGRRLMLIGLGGAGGAIGAAMAAERPRLMRLHDLDPARCERMARVIAAISPQTEVQIGAPSVAGIDILLNATPVGMLDDARMAIDAAALPSELIVFDAVVVPERTPLLALAEACGCRTVRGREMTLAQIPKLVDFFLEQNALAA